MMKWDKRFLDLAKLVSTWSKDPSTQTGAALTNHHSVLSVGFNGFPADMPDSPELYENRDEKYSRIIHCEINALLFLRGTVPPDTTLYTYPFISCDRCVVQMLQAGVKSFVAPKPSKDKLERWGEAFERTRKYVKECGGVIREVDYL